MAPSLLALLLLVPVVDDQLEPITSTAISTFSDANQKTQVVPHLSLCGMSGFSCLSRATSVCMNLLNGVSFLRPPEDEERPGARVGELGARRARGEIGALTLLGLGGRAVVGGLGVGVDHCGG